MIGFEDSVNVAEETRNPRRAFPRALFGGLVVAGVIYVLVALTASMVVDTARLAGSDGPLLEVVRVGAPRCPPTLFAGIALFAVANSALINMVMASRLVYGMADRGLVPRVFARLLPGRRTPWAAIAFTTLLAAILIVTGDLEDLADTTVMLLLVVFVVVNVSVLVLRRDRVEHEHFRAPAVLPVLGAIAAAVLIVQNDGAVFLRAGIILLVGVALWAINRLVGGRGGGELGAERLGGSSSG
ncbi:MAG: APC family permease [Thermoleophilaceae bacterium]